MKTRPLGRTGLRVSELGFGAWGIGKQHWDSATSDRQSLAALACALESGITFFDTAYSYGNGHSENLIALALGSAKMQAVIATKIPPRSPRGLGSLRDEFPPEWLVACTERSLRYLGVEAIALQQFHVWDDRWLDDPAWPETWAAVEALKKRGLILHWGVSARSGGCESARRVVERGYAETVQVPFNVFAQEAATSLFPLCRKRGVGVIARCPLDRGGLTGLIGPHTRFEPGDFRASYFAYERLRETADRARAVAQAAGVAAAELPALALSYCLSFPAVSTVIPGMRRPEHVTANAVAARRARLAPGLLKALEAHAWSRA